MRRGHTETPTRRNRPPEQARFAWIGVPVRITLEGDRLTDFQGPIIGFDRSLSTPEFQRLKNLAASLRPPPPAVGPYIPPTPPHPAPAEVSPTPSPRAPEESMEASGEPADPSLSLASQAKAVGAIAEQASPPSLVDEGPKAAPVEPPPAPSRGSWVPSG